MIRKLVNEKYAEWDKEATDLLMKFDELKKSTVELRTIANVHEVNIFVYIFIECRRTCKLELTNCIDVETGGGTGGTCPQDFAICKEVPFLF